MYHPALAEYTPRLEKHYTIMMDIFTTSATAGTSVDASKVFLNLFFDVISDLIFGKSFNALTEKSRDPIMGDFLEQQKTIGFIVMNMWSFHLFRCLPPAQASMKKWLEWYRAALEGRKQVNLS